MRLEIEFQEAYKKLDKLCRELFSSDTGVSTYIREMENANFRNLTMDQEKVNKHDIFFTATQEGVLRSLRDCM